MQTFDLYNPRQPLAQQQLLKQWISPQEENGEDFYFVKENSHLLIYVEQILIPLPTSPKYGQQRLVADQLEMPFAAIRWYIDIIEQKFFKSPEEGGLPANKISYREEVAGENLHIMRSMNAGCAYPGYDLTNSSRNSHILASSRQTFSASDPWLFQNGLMDFLKSLAADFESGRL